MPAFQPRLFCTLLLLSCFFSSSYAKDMGKPFVLSRIHTLHSEILGENRTINVYLPEGYDADSPQRYPVIYLLDGGVKEDFVHIAGLVQYSTQPWINRFPRSIVVGIENTVRQRDFTFSVANLAFLTRMGFKPEQMPEYGGSQKFIRFLAGELQYFIEDHYKTNATKTIIGESLGGLLATEILLKHRHLFDNYIILSPSLWWDKESLLKEAPSALNRKRLKPVNVYIAAARKEENQIMYDDATALADILKQYGRGNVMVHFDYLADETHATIIHEGVYRAFRRLYPRSGERL